MLPASHQQATDVQRLANLETKKHWSPKQWMTVSQIGVRLKTVGTVGD